MNFSSHVPASMRITLEHRLREIDTEQALCQQRLAQAREAGIQRRVEVEQRNLASLAHDRATIKRIGTDPRMKAVFGHFAQVKNLLNTPAEAFIGEVVRACKDYSIEQDLADYRESLFSETCEAVTRLETLLAEISIDQQFEGAEALQKILQQAVLHRGLAREASVQTYMARASRKASRKWEALRGVIFAMVKDGYCTPQWTDGFFTLVAQAVAVGVGEDVSTDDARKAYKQVQKILLEDNTPE